MAKATRPVKRVAVTCKLRAPFKLNKQARAFLQAHVECNAAEQAYQAAGLREHGKRWSDPSYRDGLVSSKETQALCQAMLAKRQAMQTMAAAIAARLKAKNHPTLDDVLLLGMAGWHAHTYHALCEVVPKAAGINMRAAA